MATTDDFTVMVQALTRLILSHHKGLLLPQGPEDPLPTYLKEVEAYLIRVIQPYCPSEVTDLVAHYNAKAWTSATIETLREHYLRVQDEAVEELRSLWVVDWERAYLVAARRARRNTPHIRRKALETTRHTLGELMRPLSPIRMGGHGEDRPASQPLRVEAVEADRGVASPNPTVTTYKDKGTNTVTGTKIKIQGISLRPLNSPASQKVLDGKVPTRIRLTPLNQERPRIPVLWEVAVKKEEVVECSNMDVDPKALLAGERPPPA